MSVNLGNDVDTTGAVYGRIAGAHYGYRGIPEEWRNKIALNEKIKNYDEITSLIIPLSPLTGGT